MHYVTWLGLWLKVKCLHREEFVVIGWTDPEGPRPFLGALLLGYYDAGGRLVVGGRLGSGHHPFLGALLLGYYEADGRLVFAGRVGSGINQAELQRLSRKLQPLATDTM